MVAVWSIPLLMAASVLGLIGWKAEAGREAAIGRAEQDIKNLVHSLAQHAGHTIRAPMW